MSTAPTMAVLHSRYPNCMPRLIISWVQNGARGSAQNSFGATILHIADYYYFDDHSSQGFGLDDKTTLAVLFPGNIDTNSSVPPNFYVGIIDGTPRAGLRGRSMIVAEQVFPLNDNRQTLKLLCRVSSPRRCKR